MAFSIVAVNCDARFSYKKLLLPAYDTVDYHTTFGRDSSKNLAKNITSANESRRANSAGTTNQFPVLCLAQTANIAPIIGPTIKPSEKAIPTKACEP